ncbi:hypothetical protein OH77DRAFT_908990 [Trametes cingulata]|nr:hypothetical protein OH77DRAFT_908990 [Trametes cingulata]
MSRRQSRSRTRVVRTVTVPWFASAGPWGAWAARSPSVPTVSPSHNFAERLCVMLTMPGRVDWSVQWSLLEGLAIRHRQMALSAVDVRRTGQGVLQGAATLSGRSGAARNRSTGGWNTDR